MKSARKYYKIEAYGSLRNLTKEKYNPVSR